MGPPSRRQSPRTARTSTEIRAAGWLLAHAAGQWHEVQRIRRFGPLDVITSPLYRCEALVCSLDPQLAVITTLHTTVRKVASMHPTWRGKSDIPLLIAMEDLTVAKAGHLHALSEASIDDVREHIDQRAAVYVEGLGVRDRLEVGLAGAAREEPVGILFVGRLERRKGVDVLLEAFENVLARCPDARLTIVGQATQNTELGVTYQEAFERRAADRCPDCARRWSSWGQWTTTAWPRSTPRASWSARRRGMSPSAWSTSRRCPSPSRS